MKLISRNMNPAPIIEKNEMLQVIKEREIGGPLLFKVKSGAGIKTQAAKAVKTAEMMSSRNPISDLVGQMGPKTCRNEDMDLHLKKS